MASLSNKSITQLGEWRNRYRDEALVQYHESLSGLKVLRKSMLDFFGARIIMGRCIGAVLLLAAVKAMLAGSF
jgi:hypothetical protein